MRWAQNVSIIIPSGCLREAADSILTLLIVEMECKLDQTSNNDIRDDSLMSSSKVS